ncbi:GpE family phage tail protein [Bergeriella denitrificans]|uniref:GpE family phage tail protein n=1 Tax=Bergeriella denitrificans TaxID=494 RepID=UPI0034E25FCF
MWICWIWRTCRHCKTAFPAKRRNTERLSRAEADKRILAAAADIAWWFGWSVQDVYALPLDEFEDWQKEATRQIKAGYARGV